MRTTRAGQNRCSSAAAPVCAGALPLLAVFGLSFGLLAGQSGNAPSSPGSVPKPQGAQPQGQQPQGQQPSGAQPVQGPPPPPGFPGKNAGQNPAGQSVGSADVQIDERVQAMQGKTIRSIRVLQVDPKKRDAQPMTADEADAITRGLLLRTGQPFEARKAREDNENLWHERRLAVDIRGQLVDDQVELFLYVLKEVQLYERIEFQGLDRLSRDDVDALLGIYPDRQVTSVEAIAMRNVLTARYRRDGYMWCSVTIEERDPKPGESSGDKPRKIATFRIDEGPRVTVRSVQFRGNTSFPSEPAIGLFGAGDYLSRDAHIQSDPSGFLAAGGPYSREIVDEDLDRLRLFYRSRGFLDATVTLADCQPTADRSEVDLVFQVVEGTRYKVRSVRVVHVDEQGRPLAGGAPADGAPDNRKPFYSVEEVAAVLKCKPGEFYDHDRIRRDLYEIEAFYGKRGHPANTFPGMEKVPTAFRVRDGWPKEHYTSDGQVELVFELYEGTPKTLRDVLIRGNQYTRDKVIRRKIYALPGDRIDMTKVQRSLRYLEATRFFQDATTFAGPRFELLPVDGDVDALNLAVDVKDGETGEFRWGIGITTGAGAQATLSFNKRNFDIWNPPSTLAPIGMFDEILGNRAFHGGGQNLDFLIAPGTEVSQFSIGFTEPDLFAQHFDTIEFRTNGRRRIRRFRDGYTTDTLGLDVGFTRNFTEEFSTGIALRQETVDVDNVSPDATQVVFDAEGQTELRGARLRSAYTDYDDPRRPASGVQIAGSYEMLGGPLGGEESLWKATLTTHLYTPVKENELGHKYVVHWENFFGVAQGFGSSDDVFLTERFYLGGQNLRGFDFRGAGPSQFGRPIGGEAIYNTTVELSVPLVATRLERDVRDRELLRGVLFSDFGLLGLGIGDRSFLEPRLSYGCGLRIEVPVLEIPIALDLAWPLLFEESDNRRQFFFSISR